MSEISLPNESSRPKIELGPQIGTLTLQRGDQGKMEKVNVHAVPDALDVNENRPFIVVNQEGTEEVILDLREREIAETTFLGKPQPETIERLEKLKKVRSQGVSK